MGTPGYLEPYQRAVRERGATWDAQLWRSPEAQRARFGAIAEVLGIGEGCRPDHPPSIADLGCGRADLAAYLGERGLSRGAYIGVEGVPELAAAARERAAEAGWPGVTILDGDFVADEGMGPRLVREHGVDAVVVSGALNTLTQDAALAVLGRFWDALSGRGTLVFNFLCERRSGPPPLEGDPANRFDPDAVLAWALRRSAAVRYRRDYLGDHDATVAMA